MSKTPQPRLLLIDNYDSFTYNLVQAFLVLGAEVQVFRNDAITVEEAKRLDITHLCISPGPGTPRDAGVSMAMHRTSPEAMRFSSAVRPSMSIASVRQSSIVCFTNG